MPNPLSQPISLHQFSADFSGFSARLSSMFRRYGFACVGDHGLPAELLRRVNDAAVAFFALPDAVKRRYHRPGTGGARGYTPFGIETAKGHTHHDLKEFWHRGRDLPEGHRFAKFMPENLHVAEVEAFDAATRDLFHALDQLGLKLLEAIAVSLGLERHFFSPRVIEGNSVLRLLHYPPIDGATPHVRAGAHEDINVITLLLGADEAGLEVLDVNGLWLPVMPPPGSLVVNIGDMLQRLTNHVLPSTTHRVVNPVPERARYSRYSMPFFQHFNPDVLIETLHSCISESRPNRYLQPITADGFLQERLREINLK